MTIPPRIDRSKEFVMSWLAFLHDETLSLIHDSSGLSYNLNVRLPSYEGSLRETLLKFYHGRDMPYHDGI